MNLIRKYKISKICASSLKGNDKEIIELLLNNFSNLTQYKEDKLDSIIFYFNDKSECVLEYFEDSKSLWIQYDIYIILQEKYGMCVDDIVEFVQYLVKELLNLSVDKNNISTTVTINSVIEQYKLLL